MQVLSKSKAKAGSGIQQREKSSFLRNEWREEYRAARILRRFEIDLLGSRLASVRFEPGGINDKAQRAQLEKAKRDPLAWKLGDSCRQVCGPKGKLP